MMRSLCIFVVLFLSVMNVSAKTAKPQRPAVGEVELPVRFDVYYYYSLSAPNRYQYIKILNDLAQKLSGEAPKTASFNIFDLLGIPEAHAAEVMCIQGGITFTSENRCPSKAPNSYNSDFSCGVGKQRCSIGAGLDEKGNPLCYNESEANKATDVCYKDNEQAIVRLMEKLKSCKDKPAGDAGCNKVASTFKKDTENLDKFCSKKSPNGTPRNGRSYCLAARKDIKKLSNEFGDAQSLRASADGKATDSVGSYDACTTSRGNVVRDALKPSLDGRNADARWLKMIEIAEKSCGRSSSTSFDSFLNRVGVCAEADDSGDNVESDLANPSRNNVRSAIGKLIAPTAGKMGYKEEREFQEYFGVTPNEFDDIFCRSKNTNEYFEKIAQFKSGIKSVPGASQTPSANEALTALLDAPNASELVGSIQDEKLKGLAQDYLEATTDERKMNDELELLGDSCGGGNDISCDKKRVLQEKITAEKANFVGAQHRLFMFNYLDKKAQELKSAGNADPSIKDLVGGKAADAANKRLIKDRETMNRGEISNAAYQAKKRFADCAASALKKSKKTVTSPGGLKVEAETAEAKIAEKKCRRVPIMKIDGNSNLGQAYIETPKRGCYNFQGSLQKNKFCKNKAAVDIPGLDGEPVCTENLEKLGTIYTFKCDTNQAPDEEMLTPVEF